MRSCPRVQHRCSGSRDLPARTRARPLLEMPQSRSRAGPYVSMLDADDLWLPEYLEVMGGALDGSGRPIRLYRCVGPRRGDAEDPSQVGDVLSAATEAGAGCTSVFPAFARAQFRLHLSDGSSLHSRGGRPVRRGLSAGEDWDLWLRLVARAPVLRPPGILAIHRTHVRSLTATRGR